MCLSELGTEQFDNKVGETGNTVLVDFWADWCGPCKQLEPRLKDLAQEYDGEVDFYRVNVEEHQELAGQFGIRSLPTLLIFNEGEKVEEIVGAVPKESIKEQLEAHR